MSHENILKAAGRICLSGILALIVLTLFSFFYSNLPLSVESEDGSTAYKWNPNTSYHYILEGFGWGKTNNDGYLNAFDYSEGMPLDVLLMGSSHMEAFQMPMSESVAGKLNAIRGSDSIYNIGVSGQTLPTHCQRLGAALRKYQPKKYVVIETHSVAFPDEDLIRAINGKIPPTPVRSEGLYGLLRRNPYLRLLRRQVQNYLDRGEEKSDSAPSESDGEQLLNQTLAKISRTAQDAGVKVIIFYHPHTAVNAEGELSFLDNPALTEQFARCCENNGIRFLDMRERFRSEYESGYVLPHGFSNTRVGDAHLNKYGHNMIAEELYRLIWEET